MRETFKKTRGSATDDLVVVIGEEGENAGGYDAVVRERSVCARDLIEIQ